MHFLKISSVCSLQRPPYSINIFSLGEVITILKFINNNYLRHYKFYKYIFTPQVHSALFFSLFPLKPFGNSNLVEFKQKNLKRLYRYYSTSKESNKKSHIVLICCKFISNLWILKTYVWKRFTLFYRWNLICPWLTLTWRRMKKVKKAKNISSNMLLYACIQLKYLSFC